MSAGDAGRARSAGARSRARLAAVLMLGACAIATLAGASSDRTKPPRRTPYAAQWPPGEGQGLASRSCLVCHSAMLVTQQAKDSTGWEKTLTQMEKWGVVLSPAEHDTLRRYLLGSFGPRPAK